MDCLCHKNTQNFETAILVGQCPSRVSRGKKLAIEALDDRDQGQVDPLVDQPHAAEYRDWQKIHRVTAADENADHGQWNCDAGDAACQSMGHYQRPVRVVQANGKKLPRDPSTGVKHGSRFLVLANQVGHLDRFHLLSG